MRQRLAAMWKTLRAWEFWDKSGLRRLTAAAGAKLRELWAKEGVRRRLLSLVAAAAVGAALLGLCLLSDGGDARRLLGEWTWESDLAPPLSQRLAAGATEPDAYFAAQPLPVTVRFDFQPDGTFSLRVDEAAFRAAMDGFVDEMSQGMARYLEDLAAQSGMSLDDVLAATGVTMDDLIGTLRQQLADEMALSRGELRGTYRLEPGHLYLAGLPGGEDAAHSPIDYAFRGDRQLRLTASPGAEDLLKKLVGAGGEDLLPMVLTR